MIKQRRFLFMALFLTLSILWNSTLCDALTIGKKTEPKIEAIEALEQKIYINDPYFLDYYIYACSGLKRTSQGNLIYGFDYVGYKPQLKFSCYHKGRDLGNKKAEPLYVNILFDKNKVYPYYQAFFDDIETAQALADGNRFLHEIVLSSVEAKYGSLVKGEDQNVYDWMDVKINSAKREIDLSMNINKPIDMDFYEILSQPAVWNQLLDSDLDLENTNILILQYIPSFRGDWGMLFYDGSSEYYLPLNPLIYSQHYVDAQYFKKSEFLYMELDKYQLYDVKKDLAPYILRECLLLEKAGERAMQERETGIPFDPNG